MSSPAVYSAPADPDGIENMERNNWYRDGKNNSTPNRSSPSKNFQDKTNLVTLPVIFYPFK